MWTQLANSALISNTEGIGYNGKFYTFGGFNLNESSDSYEYTVSSNNWKSIAPMPTARYDVTIGFYNGKAYVMGGHAYGSNAQLYDCVEIYDIATNKWSNGIKLTAPREDAEAVSKDNLIYIVGGNVKGDSSTSKQLEMFDIRHPENGWVRKADMPTGRNAHGACIVDEKIYVAGGMHNGSSITNRFEMYDIRTNKWSGLPNMPTPRRHLSLEVIGKSIYAIGGYYGDESLITVERFDIELDRWVSVTPLPVGLDRFASAVVNNKIYVASGWSNGWFSNKTFVYDPKG